MANLMEGLIAECNRVRELIPIYEQAAPNGHHFATNQMRASIEKAEKAMGSDDVIKMLLCYEELKCYDA